MSFLAACCGCTPDESLKESFDSKPFSPILNLDSHIADYGYRKLKRMHNDTKGLFERRFPAKKDLDIIVNWDEVEFKYSKPKPISVWRAEQKAKKSSSSAPSNGNAAAGEEMTPLQSSVPRTNMSASQGDYPDNKKEGESKEIFKVIYDNNTGQEISDVKLFAERKIKATYTVEVSRSLEVGHSLQIGLKSPESVGIEAGYEFSRLLTNEKKEEKTDEVETTFNTETTLDVAGNQSAVAEVTTTFQNYKETVVVESTFAGTINVLAREKKKRGRGKRKTHPLALVAGSAVRGMIAEDKDLFEGFDVHVDDDEEETVHYISIVTLSSNTGLDRHIVIRKAPLSGDSTEG